MTKIALDLHTWIAACVRELKYVYVGTFLRTQLGFQKNKKDKFFTIMAVVGMNPTLFGSYSKPHFFNYKKPYMIHFQDTYKILREYLRFTRNCESKRKFFTKHHQFNFI